MNAFDRFVSLGMADAERRIPHLARIEPRDEQAVVDIVQSSVVISAIDRVVARAERALDTSSVVARVRQTIHAIAPPQRVLLMGVVLIVAALVHAGLVLWHEPPPGWLWLILPGMAAATGLLLTVFSGRESREQG